MRLKRLSLINFKNIAETECLFAPGVNALVGSNGAGKTNVIDAIHFLSMSKSMFSLTDRQSVRHDEPFFVVDGTFTTDVEGTETVVCSFSRQSGKGVKSLKRNGKEYDKLSDHVGRIPVVVVSPQDSSLVYDSAEERRRFINSFISQFDKLYLAALIRYNATLAQRNKALKSHLDVSMLDIYDMQLAESAAVIHLRRAEITTKLQPLVEHYYKLISGDSEPVSLEHSSQLEGADFCELLMQARAKDIANEHTTVGSHRDDFVFKIGGYPLRKYGSQGQQKSFLIALKLAQYKIVSDMRGERPILLLDDLFDKLDSSRVGALIDIVSSDEFGQIFITDCNTEHLVSILEQSKSRYSLFKVDAGVVTQQREEADDAQN